MSLSDKSTMEIYVHASEYKLEHGANSQAYKHELI